MPYIKEPRHINPIIRFGIMISERVTHKRMDAARLLGWYPKAALSSGVLEGLIAHEEKGLSKRLLKLIRMQVSFTASCPFCIDMNSSDFDTEGITHEEIKALQGKLPYNQVSSLSKADITALEYTVALTRTPIQLEKGLIKRMKHYFDERQIVIIVTTIGQVNYWTRTIQGLGIKPAGFSTHCEILELAQYNTLKDS